MNEIVSQFDTLTIDDNGFRVELGYWMRAYHDAADRITDPETMLSGVHRLENANAELHSRLDAARAANEMLRQQLEAAKGDMAALLNDYHDMERSRDEWRALASQDRIGQVTDNGDGTETYILPVRMRLRMLRERVASLEGENKRLRAELDELSRSK